MKIIYFILVVFFSTACSQKNKIPQGILSQEKMRFIMWDIIRADEYANNFFEDKSEPGFEQEKAILYEQIFKLHSTKAEVFKKSLAFYEANPNLLKVVIDSLRSNERRVLMEQYNTSTPTTDTSLPEKSRPKPAQVN